MTGSNQIFILFSNQMAMTQIALFLTGGELDASKSKFTVPPPPKPKPGRFRKRIEDVPPPVLSINVDHFKTCRAYLHIVHTDRRFQSPPLM